MPLQNKVPKERAQANQCGAVCVCFPIAHPCPCSTLMVARGEGSVPGAGAAVCRGEARLRSSWPGGCALMVKKLLGGGFASDPRTVPAAQMRCPDVPWLSLQHTMHVGRAFGSSLYVLLGRSWRSRWASIKPEIWETSAAWRPRVTPPSTSLPTSLPTR